MAARPHRWYSMVALGAAMLMMAVTLVFVGFSFVNPGLAETFDAPISTVVLYYTILAGTGALSMTFLSPWLVRAFGPRAIVIAGGAWSGLVLLGMSLITALWQLYLLGFALGLTFAVATSMQANILVNAWFEARRGTVLGAVAAAAGLGGLLVGVLMPIAIDAGGWRLALQAMAVLFVLLTVPAGVFLIRSTPADVRMHPFGATPHEAGIDVEVPGVPRALAFRSAAFLMIVVAVLLMQVSAALIQHMAAFLQSHGVTLTEAGALISIQSVALSLVSATIGILNDRFGLQRTMWLGLAVGAAGHAWLAVGHGFLSLTGAMLVATSALAMAGVLVPLVTHLVFGARDFVAVLGPIMGMLPLGMSLGAPLWGLVADLTGSFDLGLWVTVAIWPLAGLLIVTAIRSGRRLQDRVEHEFDQDYRLVPAEA